MINRRNLIRGAAAATFLLPEYAEAQRRILFIGGGEGLILSSQFICDAVPIGNVFGAYGISGVNGPFTCTFTSNPGNLFSFQNGNQIAVNGVLSVGEQPIAFTITNGSVTLSATDTIDVTAVATSFVLGAKPFSVVSPANIPLPTTTLYTPLNWPAATGANYYAREKFYVNLPAATDPVCTFTISASHGGWPPATLNVQMSSGMTGATALGDPYDNEAVVIAADGTCWSFYQFTRETDTTATCETYAHCNIITDNGFGQISPTLSAGVVSSLQSCMTGALIKEEFTNYESFNHQISLCILSALYNPGYYGPAIAGDGNSSNGFIVSGQVAAIPPGTAMPSGLSAYGQAIFNAGITYGFCCNDNGGATQAYLGIGYGPSGAYATSWNGTDISELISDLNRIIPLTQKVGCFYDGLTTVFYNGYSFGPLQATSSYGNAACKLQRDSDSSQVSPGYINLVQDTSNYSTFFLGTTGRLIEWYDSALFGYGMASVGTNAPIVYQSGAMVNINGKPAMLFDGATNVLDMTGSGTGIIDNWANIYFLAVIEIPDLIGNYGFIGSAATGGFEVRVQASTGLIQILLNNGTVIATTSTAVAVNTPTRIEVSYVNTGVWTIWQNGTVTSSGTGGPEGAGPGIGIGLGDILVGAGSTSSDFFKGSIGQVFVGNVGRVTLPNNPQYSLTAGAKQYWGTA